MRWLSFVVFALLGLISTAQAEDFTVNIKVDVTADDSALAREKALNGANSSAVIAAAKRITNDEGVAQISALNQDQLVNFIKETSVTEEKTPPNRYIANLKIVVNDDLLKQYMHERNIYISEALIPQILIVPLFNNNEGGAPLLWEISNSWKQAWDTASIDSPVTFNIIKDNSTNISALSATQAAEMNQAALTEIKELNHVDDVYVLNAAYNGIDELNVAISSLSGYQDNVKVNGVKSAEDEMFTSAMQQITPLIEKNAFLQKDAPAQPETAQVTVLYPFTDLSEWISAENSIKSQAMVLSMEVQAFSPGKTQFIINYTGEIDDLITALKSAGYLLEESGNYMILKYIGD